MASDTHRVHFVREGLVIHRNSPSHMKFIWDMKVAVAKFYANNLSEEVKKGKEQKIREYKYPGSVKFGYKSIGEKRIEHVPDPELAPIVKKAFELVGNHNYSLDMVCDELYDLGVRSRKGKKKIAKSRMHVYLRDPFYKGEFVWQGKTYQGSHMPIVTEDLWNRVQAKLSRKSDLKYSKHNYSLKGIARCGECGGVISWFEKKGNIYGRCNHHRPCSQTKCAREDSFNIQMVNYLRTMQIEDPELQKLMKEALLQGNNEERSLYEASIDQLNLRLKKLEEQATMAYEDRLNHIISVDTYKDRSKAIEDEKIQILKNIESANQNISKYKDISAIIFDLAHYGSRIYEIIEPAERRELANLMFETITVLGGELQLSPTSYFADIREIIMQINSSKILKKSNLPYKIFELSDNASKKEELAGLPAICSEIRRGQDSNLRSGCPDTVFPGQPIRPLWHLSVCRIIACNL